MKKNIKQLVILNLFLFSSLFSMQLETDKNNLTLDNFPNDILVIICEFLIEDKEDSPDKVFVNLDYFRIAKKKFREISNLLFKNKANKKFATIESYNYLKFKQDRMLDLWDKKIISSLLDKSEPNKSDIDKKIDKAIELKAYFWSKKQAKEKDYQESLKYRLQQICNKPRESDDEIFSSRLQELLKLGTDPNSEISFLHNQFIGQNIERILFVVAKHREIRAVKLLLDYGADPNFILGTSSNKRTLLEYSVYENDMDLFELLLKNGPIKAYPNFIYFVNGQKRTALSQLLLSNYVVIRHIEFLKKLLENGADPRIEVTPLMTYTERSILYLYKNSYIYRYSQQRELSSRCLDKNNVPNILEILEEAVNRLDSVELPYFY